MGGVRMRPPEARAVKRRRAGARYAGTLTHRTMVDRLRAVVDGATDDQVDAGLTWYARYRVLSATLADRHGVTTEDAAAVLSILSPQCSVATSVLVADRVMGAFRAGGPEIAMDVPSGGVLPANIATAVRWLGGDREPMAMDDGTTLSDSRKTRSFFRNIMGSEDDVTVDTWATSAAGCTLEQPRGGAYVAIAEAYRATARRYGWAPRELQAVVWCAVRVDIDAAAELDALQSWLVSAPVPGMPGPRVDASMASAV